MSVAHPSTFITAAILDEIREHAHEAELLRDLHPRQLEIIFREKWLKMFVPKEFGGLAISLPEVLRVEEALAWADGSTAWVTTLCSGAGWFVGFLDPSLSQKIFHAHDLCVAGSGNVSGTAEVVKDGYKVNGSWKYASGSLHATLFTANCVINENGKPKLESDGKPLIRALAFLPNEVQVIRSWNMMGMVATASHSFSVTDLIVPSNRAFQIDARHAKIGTAIYQYPFLQLAETTLTVNLSGMAQRFLDLCKEKLSRGGAEAQRKMEDGMTQRDIEARRRPGEASKPVSLSADGEGSSEVVSLSAVEGLSVNKEHIVEGDTKLHQHYSLPKPLANAIADFASARTAFYAAAEVSWEHCKNGNEIPLELLHKVSTASRALSTACTVLVDKLYPHTGLSAADVSTEINRVWRNFHTAAQHSLFCR